MEKPLISVVVPTFNEERNIGRLVKSVSHQTYKNVETIVVDDGSVDGTVGLAKKAGARVYPREHAERSVQRNFGASMAKGKYLLVVDADMELTKGVIADCVGLMEKSDYKALVVPERTVVVDLITKIRAFEREMYMGDMAIEVARFFDKKIFEEFGGYDPDLTGPEDYDLPHRISKKYKIGRSKEYILHHEEGKSLWNLMKRKYKYAKGGAKYAKKHPELIATQGNLLFRKAYIKNWQKFLKQPILGCMFVFVRIMEAGAAVVGYISAVGIHGFIRTLWCMIWRGKNG